MKKEAWKLISSYSRIGSLLDTLSLCLRKKPIATYTISLTWPFAPFLVITYVKDQSKKWYVHS